MSRIIDEEVKIVSHVVSEEYRNGWERIFGEPADVCDRCGATSQRKRLLGEPMFCFDCEPGTAR